MKRVPKPSASMVLAVIAVVVALGGTAVAAGSLKLGNFQEQSRNTLAGTGVIQYASASLTTPSSSSSFNQVHTFTVTCELSKKATAGGFKWTGQTPNQSDYKLLDAYPNGSGFVVRLQLRPDTPVGTPNPGDPAVPSTALNKPIAVYANCVKSRAQRGSPPS